LRRAIKAINNLAHDEENEECVFSTIFGLAKDKTAGTKSDAKFLESPET
jgi:hypothetical protein